MQIVLMLQHCKPMQRAMEQLLVRTSIQMRLREELRLEMGKPSMSKAMEMSRLINIVASMHQVAN